MTQWRRNLRVITAVALAVGLLFAGTASAEAPTRETVVLNVGYTTFERPEVVRESGTLAFVRSYLQAVADASAQGTFPVTVQFNVHLGNYYQIYEWLRDESLDVAITSPFTAYLLARGGEFVPLVEFAEHDDAYSTPGDDWIKGPGRGVGHIAMVGAVGSRDPGSDLGLAFAALLDCARDEQDEKRCAEAQQVRLEMVSHFSSSGFIAPLLAADDWLLEQEGVTEELRRDFWSRLFNAVHFTVTQGGEPEAATPEAAGPALSFCFSYSGRRKLGSCGGSEDKPVTWVPLEREGEHLAIPHDVLLMRTEAAEGMSLVNLSSYAVGEFRKLWLAAGESSALQPQGSYKRVVPVSEEEHQEFGNRVRDRFENRHPTEWAAWYEMGKYEFTIDEVLCFLRQDQENTGNRDLAVVLPGGGVKAAYQARVLDELYSKRYLSNEARDEQPTDCAALGNPAPLEVRHVVGTSGGAITGVFAALRPGDQRSLERLWRDENGTLEAGDIFPALDILRWAGGLGCYLVFALFAHLRFRFGTPKDMPDAPAADHDSSRPIRPRRRRSSPDGLHVRPLVYLVWILVLFTPTGVAYVGGTRLENLPWASALIYFVMVLVGFGAIVAGKPTSISLRIRALSRGALRWWPWLAGILAMLALIAAPVAYRISHPWTYGEAWLDQILRLSMSSGALVLLVLAILLQARRKKLDVETLRLYFRSVALPLLVVVGAHAFVLVLSLFDAVTMLELSLDYWVWLLTASAVLTFVFIGVWRRWLPAQHEFLIEPQSHTVWQGRPLWALARILVIALVSWNWWVASGIYENDAALATFKEKLASHLGAKDGKLESVKDFGLETDLIVTVSSMDPIETEDALNLDAGEIYACFDGGGGCGQQRRKKASWVEQELDGTFEQLNSIADVVFASGAAFPIFPAHRIQGGKLHGAYLIDGGYGHNVPLEAASLAGARQVLVVNSSPPARPREGEMLWYSGQLLSYATNLFSFVFERSQQVDIKVRRELVVASLSPSLEHPEFPFLADFRKSVVDDMLQFASEDLAENRRIGRIENWGRKGKHLYQVTPAMTFHPDESLNLSEEFWSTGARESIERTVNRSPDPATAAFDFDNTCILNDIGEAVFVQLVAELRYAGADPRFWSLIPDEARDELRAYWEDNPKQRRRTLESLDALARADEPFRRYLVRFLKLYDEKVEASPRDAYAWVVRLFVGMTEQEVEDLTLRTWDLHAAHAVEDIAIPVDGELYSITAGIRVYPGIRELIAKLGSELGWDVWVVSASSQYSVQTVAQYVGVPPERVIGVRLETDKWGRFEDEVIAPVTYGDGKVEALEKWAGVQAPWLAAGDSRTDKELLESARSPILIDRGKLTDAEIGGDWIREPYQQMRETAVKSSAPATPGRK